MRDRDGTDPSRLPRGWCLFDLGFVRFATATCGMIVRWSVPHEAAYMNVTFEFKLRRLEFRRPVI